MRRVEFIASVAAVVFTVGGVIWTLSMPIGTVVLVTPHQTSTTPVYVYG